MGERMEKLTEFHKKLVDLLNCNDYISGKGKIEIDFDFCQRNFNFKIHRYRKHEKKHVRITEIF